MGQSCAVSLSPVCLRGNNPYGGQRVVYNFSLYVSCDKKVLAGFLCSLLASCPAGCLAWEAVAVPNWISFQISHGKPFPPGCCHRTGGRKRGKQEGARQSVKPFAGALVSLVSRLQGISASLQGSPHPNNLNPRAWPSTGKNLEAGRVLRRSAATALGAGSLPQRCPTHVLGCSQ